jgi:hypothetical protein
MRAPSNGLIVAAGVSVFVISALVTTTLAGKPRKKARTMAPPTANAVAEVAPSPYQPYTGHMRFRSRIPQTRPVLLDITLDLDLWPGRVLKSITGGSGPRIEVGVYDPDDPN